MAQNLDLLLISVDSPVLMGIYENKVLVKSFSAEGKFSDSLPKLFAEVLDSAKSQNLNQICAKHPKSRPLRGAKNQIRASSSASADFLLEVEKRGSPPKSEKRSFWRVGGAGRGVQPFCEKESSKIDEKNGVRIAESGADSAIDSADFVNYKISRIFYANGPGNFSAIKLTHIFLQTLSIVKNIPLFCADAFHFSNGEFINAYGKVHFVKENGEIRTITLDSKHPNSFSLPKELDLRIFSEDCAPLYILPAV